LRTFGLKVGVVGTVRFEARLQEHVETEPKPGRCMGDHVVVRRSLRETDRVCTDACWPSCERRRGLQALMTPPGCRPGGCADLSRYVECQWQDSRAAERDCCGW